MALKEIDIIEHKVKTGIDQFSQNIYADSVEVSGRWNDEQILMKDKEALEFTSFATIYYIDKNKFQIGDAVKLKDSPDSFRVIRHIVKYRNSSGTRPFNIAYLRDGVSKR